MSNRVFFDQKVIESNFESFTDQELSPEPSFFSKIFSFGNPTYIPSIDCIKFAISQSEQYCFIGISHYLFLLDLRTNTIQSSILNDKTQIISLGFNGNNIPFAVFSDHVSFFKYDLEIHNNYFKSFKNSYIFNTNNSIYDFDSKKGILYSISDDMTQKNVVIKNIPISKIWCHCQFSFAAISPDISIISLSDGINLSTSSSKHIEAASASFSNDGKFLCILEKNSEILHIYDGLIEINTILCHGVTVIYPWLSTHIIQQDNYDEMRFSLIKPPDPNSPKMPDQTVTLDSLTFVKPLPDGLLVLEGKDRAGNKTFFNMSRFIAVSNQELYERNCRQGNFGDAYLMMNEYGFSRDTYEIAYVQYFPISNSIIDDHLLKITDKSFIISYCKTSKAPNFEIASRLIDIGIQNAPDDEEMKLQKRRFELFKRVYGSSIFNEDEWAKFRNCNLESQLIEWIKMKNYTYPHLVLDEKTELVPSNIEKILSSISPFEDPDKYRCLMPKNKDYFIKRADEIDLLTGQSTNIINLLSVGASYLDSLNDLKEKAIEFDTYVSTFKTAKIDLTFKDYREMNELDQLHLFLKDLEINENVSDILKKNAGSILKRNPNALNQLYEEILTTNHPPVFSTLTKEERISLIGKLNPSPELINEVLMKLDTPFSSSYSQIILDNWEPFLSEKNIIIVELCKYYAEVIKPMKISDFISNLTPSFLMDLTETIIQKECPPLTLNDWPKYKNILDDFFTKFESNSTDSVQFREKLMEYNIRATIKLHFINNLGYDSGLTLYIENVQQTHVVLHEIEELIKTAQSSSLDDPKIETAYWCLLFIQNEKITNEIKTRINRYNIFAELLDSKLKPKEIDDCKNQVDLVIQLAKKMSGTLVERYNKACKALLQLDLNNKENLDKLKIKFCEFAIDENDIEFGKQFLSIVPNSILIRYLKHQNWTDKDMKMAECQKHIKTLNIVGPDDEETFSQYIEILADVYIYPPIEQSAVDYIARYDNIQEIKFALSRIPNDKIPQIFIDYGKGYQPRIKPLNTCQVGPKTQKGSKISQLEEHWMFLDLYVHLMSINEELQYSSQLIEFIEETISIADDEKGQIELVREIIEMNIPIHKDKICLILSNRFTKKTLNFTIQSTEEFKDLVELWESLKDSEERKHPKLANLVDIWYLCGQLGQKEVSLVAKASPKLRDKYRDLLANVMDEKTELVTLQSTNDTLFGLSSSNSKVVEESYQLLMKSNQLSEREIDSIIENEDVHRFVGTKHLQTIYERATGKNQLQHIFNSLSKNNHEEALIKYIASYFLLPEQFTFPMDSDEIIQIANELLKN